MEEYIKQIERRKRKEYMEYVAETIDKLGGTANTKISSFKNINWKEFWVKDVFSNLKRGKRLIRENQKNGNVPYVSSSAINNGVDNFISNENGIRKYKNCLSLANSGSVGSCFYEPFEFIASDHITHLKDNKFNKYSYLFIATALNRLSDKYNFNREINDDRIRREKVLLPINQSNEIDIDYMEKYIKRIMLKKLIEYCEFIKYKSLI